MSKRIAWIVALAAALVAGPAAADTLTGRIVAIDLAGGKMKVGGAEVRLGDIKLDGFKVGDEVQITYTQDDVHDPYILKAIVKK